MPITIGLGLCGLAIAIALDLWSAWSLNRAFVKFLRSI